MNDHFRQLFPGIGEVLTTPHFKRDIKNCACDFLMIADAANLEHPAYHKFEERIGEAHVFRALENGRHIVYAVDGHGRLIFLRAFSNLKRYEKFLEDKPLIKAMIAAA